MSQHVRTLRGTREARPRAQTEARPQAEAREQVIHLQQYQPGTALDGQLAALAYTAMSGWPDQRPVTPALVRSRLTITSTPPAEPTTVRLTVPGTAVSSLVVTCRDTTGQVIAAAALRPATPMGPGRLWGPGVDPAHRGNGLGRRLLDALTEAAHHSGIDLARLSSAEIPVIRSGGRALFTNAGWVLAGELSLLRRGLPFTSHHPETLALPRVAIRLPAQETEPGLAQQIGNLYQRCHPGVPSSIADATLARWSADERFTPDCLTLAETDGQLLGAALVYPLAHTWPSEPTEALLADLLITPNLDTGTAADGDAEVLRVILSWQALTTAATVHDARTARALPQTTDTATIAALTRLGFADRGTCRTYRPLDLSRQSRPEQNRPEQRGLDRLGRWGGQL